MYQIRYLILLVICFLIQQTVHSVELVQDTTTLKILTPQLQEQKRMKLRLDNQMQVLLISDPQLADCAVALSVHVGSWSDPKDHPGLAHFLEHMLFLGTTTYPKESDFDQYIASNGGSFNAATYSDFATYYFIIPKQSFEGALDRFSLFFKEPLFNASGVEREIRAIDEEYALSRDETEWKQRQILKIFANPQHPESTASLGNYATLAHTSPSDLKTFFDKNYSANLMNLVIASPLPLAQLKTLVIDKFSHIPNKNAVPLSPAVSYTSTANREHMIYITPSTNTRELALVWDIPPSIVARRDAKAGPLVNFVLGHEGKNSLLAHLKQEELADDLTANEEWLGADSNLLWIRVSLTDKGLRNTDQVIDAIFQAINNLKQNGIPRYLFDEYATMQTLNYQYQKRPQYLEKLVETLASNLIYEPLASTPLQSSVVQTYDPAVIKKLLTSLIPAQCTFILTAPEALTGVKSNLIEPWYNTPYAIKKIPQKMINRWSFIGLNRQITLPPPNPFIPKQLALVDLSDIGNINRKLPYSEVIMDDANLGKVYYVPNQRLPVPEIDWTLRIKSPRITLAGAESAALCDLFVRAQHHALNALIYTAGLAGLHVDMKGAPLGLSVNIAGYSEHAELLLNQILTSLKNVLPSREQFSFFISALRREYDDANNSLPLIQANELFDGLVYNQFYSAQDKLEALKHITYEKFIIFTKSVFDKNYLEALLFGDITRNQAKAIWESYRQKLGGRGYPLAQQPLLESIRLPDDGPYYIEKNTKEEGNAIELAIQCGAATDKACGTHELLMQNVNAPFYTQLRTEQQTGYAVSSSSREVEGTLYSIFDIQSATYNVRDLVARCELFLESYLQGMAVDPQVAIQFELDKQRFIEALNSPLISVAETIALLKEAVFQQEGDFYQVDRKIAALKTLTFVEYLAYARQTLSRDNRRRCSLCVEGIMSAKSAFDYKEEQLSKLRSKSTFVTKEQVLP